MGSFDLVPILLQKTESMAGDSGNSIVVTVLWRFKAMGYDVQAQKLARFAPPIFSCWATSSEGRTC